MRWPGNALSCILAAVWIAGCGQKETQTTGQAPVSVRGPKIELSSEAADKTDLETEPAFDVAAAEILYKTKCSACHAVDKVAEHAGHVHRWTDVVSDMIQKRGAKISAAEAVQIVRYLEQAFPK